MLTPICAVVMTFLCEIVILMLQLATSAHARAVAKAKHRQRRSHQAQRLLQLQHEASRLNHVIDNDMVVSAHIDFNLNTN